MIERTIGPRSGKLVSICEDAGGFAYVYQDEADGTLVLGTLSLAGVVRVLHAERIGAPNSFPVITRWRQMTWVAWRQNPTNEGWLWNVTTGARHNLGVVEGNNPIALTHAYVAWCSDAAGAVTRRPLDSYDGGLSSTPEVFREGAHGTGLAYAMPLTSWDSARLLYPHVVHGREAGVLYCGENPSGTDRVIVRHPHTDELLDLWVNQFSPQPRIACYDDDHYAVATSQGPGVRVVIFSREDLRVPPPPPPPPVTLPDIPWKTDLTRTVDVEPFLDAASTARLPLGDGRWIWWLKKSPEQPGTLGEHWYADRRERVNGAVGVVGLLEDTSNGTRMASVRRDPEPGNTHKNLTRNRISRQELDRLNAAGANLGRWEDLPVAGNTFEKSALWMPLTFTGRFRAEQQTTYRWWDLPEFGGTWEVWNDVPLVIEAEAGYGRYGGHEVFARTRYGKPDGTSEWNYWGPDGWVLFTDVVDNTGQPKIEQPGGGPSEKGPYVPSRFTPHFPIYNAPVTKEHLPVSTTIELAEAAARARYPVRSDFIEGAFARFRDEVCLSRDKIIYRDQNDQEQTTLSLPAMRYFAQHFGRVAASEMVLRGVPGTDQGWGDIAVRGLAEAAAVYDHDQKAPGGGGDTRGSLPGALHTRDGRFIAGGVPLHYQAISAFCLIGHAMQGRRDEVLRQLDVAKRAGRNAVRVFSMLRPINGNFGVVQPFHPDQPGWDAAADFVINEAADRGLYVGLGVFADCSPRFGPAPLFGEADLPRILDVVVRRFREHPAVTFRIANEARQNMPWDGEADDPRMLALADRAADLLGHQDFAISDILDGDNAQQVARMQEGYDKLAAHSNILVWHPSRLEDGDRLRWLEHLDGIRDLLNRGAWRGKAGIIDEPMGAASMRQTGRRDNRAAVHAAAAWIAAVLGVGYTYHRIAEQDDATPGLVGAAAAFKVNPSSSFRYVNANLGGSWVGTFSGYDKVRPCSDGQTGFAAAFARTEAAHMNTPGFSQQLIASMESDGVVAHLWTGARE